MEDAVSRTSQDSAADEFVVVSSEPKLHIAGNGGASELERKMTEVLNDDSCTVNTNSSSMDEASKLSKSLNDKPVTLGEVQQSDVSAATDASNVSHRPESGNSFNNLNTSTNTTAESGNCYGILLNSLAG